MTKLDLLMRHALAELEMLAAPRAGQMHYGSKGEADKAGPPFVPDVVGYWRRRFEAAETEEERRACVQGAAEEIRTVKLGVHPVDERIREARLKIGADERSIDDVMYVYRCSRATVYRCRAEAKQAGRRAA